MSHNKLPKLELTWIGKDEKREPLEPRILIENSPYSYGDAASGNMLIHGDNLLALKALEQEYTGKVKCIYIDPPYNTGNAFEHYDDGLEHSIWLSLMRERLKILYNLLMQNGSIWISIDADESHYLKVLCDEIFERRNFVDEVIWQRSFSPINLKKTLSRSHDTLLVYTKDRTETFELNKLPRSTDANNRYKNPDHDPRGMWTSGDLSVGPRIEEKVYEIRTPSGRIVLPPDGYCWRLSKDRFYEYVADNRIWFGENGDNTPRIKRFLSEVKNGITAMTLWGRNETGDNQEAKREIKAIFQEDKNPFDTPKPERLIERILLLGSNPGDLVLDSFLGSGTTAAVAQKMGRRYIGIELGNHAYTYCYPRLKKVVDGTDQGGISKAYNWKGGGGFKFYELAPSLLKEDKFGHLVINKAYNGDMLAAAIAKQEGYKYQPDKETYWKQGQSSEQDFIYTTTQFITIETLDVLADSMGEGESLLICCTAFQKECQNRYSRITLKKIPQILLGRCEFGVNDDRYNLNIINSPQQEEPEDLFDIEEQPEKEALTEEKKEKTLFD